MALTKTLFNQSTSAKIFKNSCRVIPSGVNSPVRSFGHLNSTPVVAVSGLEDMLTDADGNPYIDYCGSWGALIHGHAHPEIVKAVCERVAMGSSFGITTEIEYLLAQKVTDCIPSIEKVRFVSSGTEATMSAVRLARGYTKRTLIIKFSGHYHGHADSFLVQAGSGVTSLSATSSSQGVPEEFVKHTLCLPFNDFEALDKAFKEHGDKIACVILEPVAANMGLVLPKPGFLQMVRMLTLNFGALLVFDEVITGFRVALGGAQELFGITPDLTCLGKVIGGGFPAAAFGGKSAIMDHLAPMGGVYQAGTLSGNPVAMAAGLVSLQLCEETGFYEKLKKKTHALINPIQAWIEKKELPLVLEQLGSLFTLFFGRREGISNFEDAKKCNLEQFNAFYLTLLKKGVYFSPSQFEAHFVSQAHTSEHIQLTTHSVIETLDEIFR